MINGAHTVLYAEDAEAARAFFRDVLGWKNVDAGGGWLIFKTPPSELALHPADPAGGARHELFLMCDDINATVADLTSKGVEFTSGIEQRRYGLFVTLKVPGAGEIALYEPRHAPAHAL